MADPKKILGGLGKVKQRLLAEPPPAYSPKILESTTAKFADKIADANPKLTDAEVQKKALAQATKKLEWERVQKPALEKQYGALGKASFADSNPNKMQNTAEVVAERKRKANEFLDQPTEPWTPPRKELQAFDRSSIKDAMEGFPGVEQSSFPRDIPTRASTSHVEELYSDPENRALITKQIKRGLPLGGETFYGSLYPVKQAVQEAGIPVDKFDKWIHSVAPASARNSIMNEMAVGQFLRNMNARGIPLTEENVAKEMALYKEKFGIGLPLMPIHRQGVANVLEGGQNLREMSKANIPTNYKIPTYGTQKAGDFSKSVVLDVHEAGGHTQGSRFHPYFNEQGGFGNTEYGAGEQGLLGIAQDLGIPGGMAQAGRWFGGGELTGLRSPRGDALDLLEKQVAYTLKQKGIQPNPANVRAEVLNQIKTGEGDLLPYYRKEAMPDVRETGLQRAEGGEVNLEDADRRLAAAIQKRMAKGGKVSLEASDAKLRAAIQARMAKGGQVGFKKIEFMADGGKLVKGLGTIGKKLMAEPTTQSIVKTPQKAIGIEAPSIIIPSKLGRVKEAVRDSKGDYGVRRVERAADEIPNLERLYKEQALREAFLGDNAKAVMTMNPADFQKYAKILQERSSLSIGPKASELAKQGDISKGTVPTEEYIKHLQRVQGGFDDMPYLVINKEEQGLPLMPFISGHEGRHRSRAMAKSGEPSSLVMLSPRSELREPFPRRSQEEYIEALKRELEMTNNMVLPEGFDRPPLKLPDIYAEGGGAFKKLTFMDKGGKVGKVASGIAKVGKRLMADPVLPAAERDANLAKMLQGSKVKERLYHGTKVHDDYADEAGQAFNQFTGKPTWLAKEPYTASGYSGGTGSTYPVHAQIKNPLSLNFDANDEASKAFPIAKRFGVDIDHMTSMRKPKSAWEVINDPAFVDAVEAAGHDGLLIKEGGYKTYGVFNPAKIKSAIGNRGTYDITDPDINKAKGGKIVKGGLNIAKRLMADNSLPAIERDANLAKFLEPSKTPMRLYHGTTATEGGKGTEAIRRLKPSKEGALGSGVYMTPKTNYSDQYTYKGAGNYEGGNTLPVHAQIKNPLVIDGSASNDPMIEALIRLGMGEAQASRMVERAYDQKGYIGKEVQSRAQAQGYDGLMQYHDGDLNEVVSYQPNAVKSAIGNQGTYDINQPDLSKARGGLAYMDKGGKAGKIAKGIASVRDRLLADAPQADALKLAQERAALPPAKGGLGLPKKNTSEQRANAMGIKTDAYHGTKQDITGAFKPGYNDNLAFVTHDPEFANKWIGKGKIQKRAGPEGEAELKSAEDLYRALKEKHMDFESLDSQAPNFHAEYDKRNSAFKEALDKEMGLYPDKTHSTVYPLRVQANKTFDPETDMDVMAEFFAKNNTPPQNQELYKSGNYLVYETKPVVEYLKSKGYDSMRLRESTGDNYPTTAVFNPETVRSRFAAFDPFRKDAATAAAMGVLAPDLLAKEVEKAEGGAAFKKLQFMDKGGITTSAGSFSPEELGVTASDLRLMDEKTWNTIKNNAPDTYEWIKQNVKDEASQLKSARGMKDFALRVGASYAGGIPDFANFVLMAPDAVFGTNLSSEKPWFGSAQYLDAMTKAGMLGENEFPIAEGVAGILTPAGLIKKGIKKGAQLFKGKKPEESKKRRGGLAAMAR